MDILNYISWIAGKKRVVTSVPDDALLPVGIRTESRDDKYTTVAIKKSDLAAQLGGDRLIAGNREVVLGIDDDNNDTTLTFSPGDVIIQTTGAGADLYIRSLGGDDIFIESGDDITLRGDKGTYDNESEGGDINIFAGDGSDGDTNDAGSGGDVRIEAGDAGNSISGNQGEGGFVTIQAGYTTASGLSGGDINFYTGNSADGIHGDVIIQGAFTWEFVTRNAILKFPAVTLATLPNPAGVPGARAMIADSNLPAPGNFGAIAATGGSAIVPVFSDGVNWLIG
jgi:hypothetical protein